MASKIIEKFLGQDKTPLEEVLSTTEGTNTLTTLTELYDRDLRLPELDLLLEDYGLNAETVIKDEYNPERFPPSFRGEIKAYRHRVNEICDQIAQEESLRNHSLFEGASYSISNDLEQDRQFIEENLC